MIKLAPIMLELDARGVQYYFIDSGQHSVTTSTLRKTFGIREPDSTLYSGKDISSVFNALTWATKLLFKAILKRDDLVKNLFPRKGLCIVHGDTLSTLIGTLLARLARINVVHIESGLRSWKYLDPFPEEIIRIIVMRLASVLIPPSDEAYLNLAKMKTTGDIIKIDGNTVYDAIMIPSLPPPGIHIPQKGYILATCHRLETITSRKRLNQVIQLIERISEKYNVIFVVHKSTNHQMKKHKIKIERTDRVTIVEQLDYLYFSYLLKASEGVIADGGSIQEECAHLAKPCLIIRNATERKDGIGETAILWKFNPNNEQKFISLLASQKTSDTARNLDSPSKKIAETLVTLSSHYR